ncbi:ATP-binding protein [Nocardia sp. alder85J]|uniref:ATP-binding protein n=1 Tax=Nocardia sp. alder85J TaxID=2862949 RepID=UPI001CD524BB|nr:ATP-binding protein [Nocardia sp. alder85J]MCX4095257.1 ATP-binding protein [Nocardia sp. alder85J]
MPTARLRWVQSPAPLRLTFPAQPSALAPLRRTLRQWLTQAGLGADRTADMVLAVTEACTNAVEHAYVAEQPEAGTIRVDGELLGEVLRITIVDGGHWKTADSDPNTLRGRGLAIMRAVVPDTFISTSPAGTTVELRATVELHALH